MAEIIDVATLKDNSLDQSRTLAVYCGLDCCITKEIKDVIAPQVEGNPNAKLIYDFEMALRAPVMDMQLRGILVDVNERRRALQNHEKRLEALKEYLNTIIETLLGWRPDNKGWRLNPSSPQKLKYLFYGVFGLKEHHKFQKGERTVTVNAEALKKFSEEEDFPVNHIADILLALRDVSKIRGVLRSGVEKDNRMRFSYSIAGTITGRFSSSKNVYNRGCVKPSAEVYTQKGWKPLGEVTDSDELLQYNLSTKELTYCPAVINTYLHNGWLSGWDGEQVALMMTDEHRIPYQNYSDKKTRVGQVKIMKEFMSSIKVPTAGIFRGGNWTITPLEARLLAMHLADGSKSRMGSKFNAVKKRKHNRLRDLLEQSGWRYTETICQRREGYRTFYMWFPEHLQPFMDKDVLVNTLLAMSHEAACAFLDEQQYWDGNRRGKSIIMYTANQHWAETIQSLACLHGFGSTVVERDNARGYNAKNTGAKIYKVNIKPRDYVCIEPKLWQRKFYRGVVMCPTTETGFFLVRENGKISVTGNSNSQNFSNKLRRIFVADEGRKMGYCDLSGAEARVVAYRAQDEKYIEANEGDLKVHTYVAQMIWDEENWPNDPDLATKYAEETKFAGNSMYKASKIGQHLSNYWGAPSVMAKSLGIPLRTAKEFQNTYYDRFSGIAQWHKEVVQMLQIEGEITTALGRRRKFFKRRDDHTTIREAIAYEPQSTIGDLLNLAMYRVWKAWHPTEFPVRLLSQLHDAILIDYPEEREAELLPKVLEMMTIPIWVKGREVIIPVDAKTGWNWEEVKSMDLERNPDGLVGWSPDKPDTRRRYFPAKIDPMDLIC